MAKFGLFFIPNSDGGQWRLEPYTPDAYKYAITNLSGEWTDGIQASQAHREVFTFETRNAPISVVLDSIRRAGIAEGDATLLIFEIWRCATCGETWEILCEPLPQGGGPSQVGNYGFSCPNKCVEEFSRKAIGTTMPGLSFRPLKYRKKDAAAWIEISPS